MECFISSLPNNYAHGIAITPIIQDGILTDIFFEGTKHREIAAHLRISERASKSNLSAARVFYKTG